mgnify:CR=1 FL=1
MSYPANLRSRIQRLSNYSRNGVRVHNEQAGSIVDGASPLKFTLPPNSLCDLSSCSIHCKITGNVAGQTATAGQYVSYNLAKNLGIIDRITIDVNGQAITIKNYSKIRDVLLNYTMGEANNKFLYGNYDPSKRVNSSGIEVGVTQTLTEQQVKIDDYFTLDRFISFLAGEPIYIPTSIVGQVQIIVELLPPNKCMFKGMDTDTASDAPTYTLSDISMTLDKISIDDGVYWATHEQALASGMPFEFKFNNFHTIEGQSGGKTMTLRTEIQSGSVDMAFFSFHPADEIQPTGATDKAYNVSLNNHQYFQRSLANITGLQWSVNGEARPQYKMKLHEIYNNALTDFEIKLDRDGGISEQIANKHTWENYFAVATCKFSHPMDGTGWVSGTSSEGVPLSISITTDCSNDSSITPLGNKQAWVPEMTIMTTNVLQSFAGRNIVLIK